MSAGGGGGGGGGSSEETQVLGYDFLVNGVEF